MIEQNVAMCFHRILVVSFISAFVSLRVAIGCQNQKKCIIRPMSFESERTKMVLCGASNSSPTFFNTSNHSSGALLVDRWLLVCSISRDIFLFLRNHRVQYFHQHHHHFLQRQQHIVGVKHKPVVRSWALDSGELVVHRQLCGV